MATTVETLSQMYSQYIRWADVTGASIMKWADPSQMYLDSPIKDYPLMQFSTAFAFLVAYLMFIVFGTLLMSRSWMPAFNTRPLQFIYNPLQVLVCAYMTIETAILLYRNNYPIFCPPYNGKNPVIHNVLYLFYVTKLFDFLDTVFIIASKKWNQLSFLHLYHHSTIWCLYWLNANVAYDADMYMTIFLNSGIHFIMYMYYFVSYHTKDIWWKKYLTGLQIIQFFLMNAHAWILTYLGCCQTPPVIHKLYTWYILTLIALFAHFYYVNYIAKKKRPLTRSAKKNN